MRAHTGNYENGKLTAVSTCPYCNNLIEVWTKKTEKEEAKQDLQERADDI